MDCFPETSIILSIPEELGFIDNAYAHITLSNGTYFCEKAFTDSRFRYHSDGSTWPKIFREDSKEQVLNLHVPSVEDTSLNTSVFGIVYPLKDMSYLEGYCVFTFRANNTDYYTESLYFKVDKEDYFLELDEN